MNECIIRPYSGREKAISTRTFSRTRHSLACMLARLQPQTLSSLRILLHVPIHTSPHPLLHARLHITSSHPCIPVSIHPSLHTKMNAKTTSIDTWTSGSILWKYLRSQLNKRPRSATCSQFRMNRAGREIHDLLLISTLGSKIWNSTDSSAAFWDGVSRLLRCAAFWEAKRPWECRWSNIDFRIKSRKKGDSSQENRPSSVSIFRRDSQKNISDVYRVLSFLLGKWGDWLDSVPYIVVPSDCWGNGYGGSWGYQYQTYDCKKLWSSLLSTTCLIVLTRFTNNLNKHSGSAFTESAPGLSMLLNNMSSNKGKNL